MYLSFNIGTEVNTVNLIGGIRVRDRAAVVCRAHGFPGMTTKRPKRRIEGTARRAQILRVAGDMFAKDGIDATSMRRIAAKAGVTATLLYKHFADKAALLSAIGEGFFLKLAADLEQTLTDGQDPVARLRALMRAYVRCGIANPREYHLTFMTALPGLR